LMVKALNCAAAALAAAAAAAAVGELIGTGSMSQLPM
jgi:hypothetical protein